MLKLVPEIVGIQVSCSAEDHSAVWDGRFPVSNYSRTSLYIAGHLLPPRYNQAINQPSHHTFQQKYPMEEEAY